MTSRGLVVDCRRALRGPVLALVVAAAVVWAGCGGGADPPADGGHEAPLDGRNTAVDGIITTTDGSVDCNVLIKDACVSTYVEAKRTNDSCDFSLDDVMWSRERPLAWLNLRARIGFDGEPTLLFRVDTCTADPGWAFDDPAAPTKIMLCPATCAAVRAPGSAVEWAFGCGGPLAPPPMGCFL